MQSANLSMSRFRQYSIGSLFNSAKGAFNDTLTEIKKTYSEVEKAVTNFVDETVNQLTRLL